MNTIAIYPGTFDPIHNGHVNIVKRAARLFDTVIVAVAEGIHKIPHFSWEDRTDLCRDALINFANVNVMRFEGLLVNFAHQHHAKFIVRGLRTAGDFEYEFPLAGMNATLAPEVETIFLAAQPNHSVISASIVREIIALGGDVSAFVPDAVLLRLKRISSG